MSKYCVVYEIKPSKIIDEILAAGIEPKSGIREETNNVVCNYTLYYCMYMLTCYYLQCLFNFIRATYRVLHFAYLITNYSHIYKLECCEDMEKELKQMRVVDTQVSYLIIIHSISACLYIYIEGQLGSIVAIPSWRKDKCYRSKTSTLVPTYIRITMTSINLCPIL